SSNLFPGHLTRERSKLLEIERLRSVGKRTIRLRMNFNHDTVCAHCARCPRQRRDPFAATGGMAWIDNYGQMCAFAQHRHSGEIEGVARRSFERANAALTKDDAPVTFGHDVLSGGQPFIDRSHQTAF